MKKTIARILCTGVILCAGCFATGQSASRSQGSIVPRLMTFSGTAVSPDQKAASRVLGITFALYKEQQGGAPLWLETQSVPVDKYGRYTVSLV